MTTIENLNIYNLISDTFKTDAEEISMVLQWRQQYLEKTRDYNKQYSRDKTCNNPEKYEATKQRSKKWFQINKQRAAARQKARYENDPDYRSKLLEYKRHYYAKQKQKKKETE